MYRLPPVVPTDFSLMERPSGMYTLQVIGLNSDSALESSSASSLTSIERRQDDILKRLTALKQRVDALGSVSGSAAAKIHQNHKNPDVVIRANPAFPPHSLPLVCTHLQDVTGMNLFISTHLHSSVSAKALVARKLQDFMPAGNADSRSTADLCVSLIWMQEVGVDPELFVAVLPGKPPILGEVNLLRFFARAFNVFEHDVVTAKEDELLDEIHSQLIWGNGWDSFEEEMQSKAKNTSWNMSNCLLYSSLRSHVKQSSPLINKFCEAVEDSIKVGNGRTRDSAD